MVMHPLSLSGHGFHLPSSSRSLDVSLGHFTGSRDAAGVAGMIWNDVKIWVFYGILLDI
jgi:hypothetical protein